MLVCVSVKVDVLERFDVETSFWWVVYVRLCVFDDDCRGDCSVLVGSDKTCFNFDFRNLKSPVLTLDIVYDMLIEFYELMEITLERLV